MSLPDTFTFYYHKNVDLIYTANAHRSNKNEYVITWKSNRPSYAHYNRREVEEYIAEGSWVMERIPKNNKEALHLLEKVDGGARNESS